MEKTHNEQQKIWDTYANEALTLATSKFSEIGGKSLFAVPNDKFIDEFITLFARLMEPQNDGNSSLREAFFLLLKKMDHFYTGYAAETLVLYEWDAFVCVRVENELMYAHVKPWDLPHMKMHARKHDLIYDMRNVQLLALKNRYISMQNVLIGTF